MTSGRKILFAFALALLWSIFCGFTDRNRQAELNKEGNECYESGEMERALTCYTKALNRKYEESKPLLHTNIGNVFYKLGEYDKALAEYLLANSMAENDSIKADSYYNSGNAYFQKQMYEKAVESYIESLKINPDNEDARHNFELSLKMLEQQQKQEEEKNEQKEDEKKDENSREEDSEDREQEDKEQDQKQKQPEKAEEQKNEESAEKIEEQEMERLLNMIEDEDKETQEERVRSAILKEIPQGDMDDKKDW